MPRETFDINDFSKGIILRADQADIPENSAVWAQNVDGSYPHGKLAPRYSDSTTTIPAYGVRSYAWIVRSDGKKDLIFHDAAAEAIKAIADFYGTPAGSTLQASVGTTHHAMQTHNAAVHLGKNGSAPKWCGYIPKGQFDGAAPSTLQYLDAELAPPSAIPAFYKVIYDSANSCYFGIEWEGKHLWRIDASTGACTASAYRFERLRGLCSCDADNVYVYDYVGNFGLLLRVSKDELSMVASFPLSGWETSGVYMQDAKDGAGATLQCSDIEQTATKIWFMGYHANGITYGAGSSRGFLYNVTEADLVDGESFNPNHVSWLMSKNVTPTAGYFNNSDTEGMVFPRQSLIKLESGELGVLCDVTGDLYKNGSDSAVPGWSAVIVNESLVYGELFTAGTNAALVKIDLATDILSGVGFSDIVVLSKDGGGLESFDAAELSIAGAAWTGTGWQTTTAAHSGSMGALAGNVTLVMVDDGATNVTLGVFASSGPGLVYTQLLAAVSGTFSTMTYVAHSPATIDVSATTVVNGDFDTAKKHWYNISFTYDDYQESPMIPGVLASSIEGSGLSANKGVRVEMSLYDTANTVSKRVTAINIYHAEGVTGGVEPEGFYRYVTQIPIDHNWGSNTSYASSWGAFRTYVFYDNGTIGPSYEANTGISEGLFSHGVQYGLSAQYGGYHVVSKCTLYNGTDASRYVFRSKQNAFDMVDWTKDFCILPEIPVALAAYQGYVYAFSTTAMYRIDLERMAILDVIPGVGVADVHAVKVVSYGIVVATPTMIQLFNGQAFQSIGMAIANKGDLAISGATDWVSLSGQLSIEEDMLQRCVLVFVVTSATTAEAFVYYAESQRWEHWTFTGNTTAVGGLFAGKLGETYFSYSNGCKKVCGSASRGLFLWYSRTFDFGRRTQKKRFYGADATMSSGTAIVTISHEENPSIHAPFAVAYANCISVAVIASTPMSAFSIQYRRMIGER